MFVVGIDLGGTGTRAALATSDGEVLAAGRGGPSGAHGGAAGRRHIERALAAALAPIAPRVGAEPCCVHVGVRGLSIPGRRDAVLVALSARLPQAQVHVSNDALTAVWGGVGGGDGVAVLAGTGSIAMARTADGREARSGGYGYLVGDEGSGFWLGRAALAACLRTLDGRGPATRVHDLVCESTGQTTAAGLIAWLYTGGEQVPRLAALAPLVTRAADELDPVALAIVDRAARDLADLAASAARQLWSDHVPAPVQVACCGGVWAAGDVLRRPFESALQHQLPSAQIGQPRLTPLGGAVLLALRAQGAPIDDDAVARLARALR